MAKIAENGLDILVRNGGFQFTDTFFPYTSGEIGPYYVQSGVVQNNGRDYQQAVSQIVQLVKEDFGTDFDVVTGGESRDWIFSGPVALQLGLPHTMLYKNGKKVGADLEDKRVLHVADLNNEGSSPRDSWVPAITKAGGKVKHISFYVDRMEDGVNVMEDLGLKSTAAVELDERAWDYLQGADVLDSATYRNLMTRMEDKNVWARDMLRSDAGFTTLRELYNDRDTRAKAEKILEVGYPDLKDELVKRLAA